MDSLYNRYALGLFSIALEENKVLEYKNSVKMFKDVIVSNSDLKHLFLSYFVLQEEKEDVINNIFKGQDEYLLNFLKIIVKNKRVNCMVGIFDEFICLCNDFLKVKEGIVYSTELLSSDDILRLESKFKSILSCDVELENVIDKKLIGGIKVVIEDRVYDGSIKNKISKLRLSLKEGEKND